LELHELDLASIQALLADNQCSCEQIVEHFLTRINEGSYYNAFISILGDHARARARQIDQKRKQHGAGKLAGLVIAVKDNIATRGANTTCGSKMLARFQAPYDATVIKKLQQADAIIIGKTNMDEFAMGSSNETSYFGAVKNPYDISRVPGGSSGGSAVAVAAHLAMAALGSDTGGSIRLPASFCGVVGLKPTYGRVSRFGLVAYASSFDQIGPMARSVSDCAKILTIIAGHDPQDSTAAPVPVPDYSKSCRGSIAGMTIGIPNEYFAPGLQVEINDQVDRCCRLLAQQGASIVRISLPHTDYAIASYYILATAEASSNLARYDGVRYGYRAPSAESLEEMYLNSRSGGFGEEVKRRIMLGSYVLSAGYYEAYYEKARKVRTLIRQDFDRAFEQCDCLLTPTAPTTAFKLGEKSDDPLTMYLSDIYTVSANLAGIPAMSLPCGYDSQQLPIGIQLLAKPFDEETLFKVGYALEQTLRNSGINLSKRQEEQGATRN